MACGGHAVNSVEDLDISDLGYAGHVYETSLGDDKYTFIEDVKVRGLMPTYTSGIERIVKFETVLK